MNNVNKTTKTILLASLLTALILPLSTIGTADAITEKDRAIAELKERISNLQTSTTKATDGELQRYKLALAQFEAEGDEEAQREIMKELKVDLPKKYTPARDATGSDFASVGASIQSYMGPIYYTGSTEKNWNCQYREDDTGNIDGSVTMYGTGGTPGAGYSYLVVDMNYPSHISKSAFPGCGNEYLDHSTANIISLTSTSNTCQITTFSSASDTEGKICDDIEAGMLVLIEGQSFYSSGNGNPFSPYASDTIKFLWA